MAKSRQWLHGEWGWAAVEGYSALTGLLLLPSHQPLLHLESLPREHVLAILLLQHRGVTLHSQPCGVVSRVGHHVRHLAYIIKLWCLRVVNLWGRS